MIFTYDAVVVGAGGAGLRAALGVSRHGKCAVVTKVFPTRSHTGTAQGGMGAALGNMEEDRWEWHMFDTVKGSDYLGDQDAIEILTKDAPAAVYELEHLGMPFSRTPEGRIAQRPFGGHTRNYGEAPVRRACYAADRTGHVMLQTLYENCLKQGVEFFSESFLVDLIVRDNVCRGVVIYDIKTGEIHTLHAKAVMLATGGAGRAYRITSNAHGLVGDGIAAVFNNGLPIEDMEFVQFHPTGLWKLGILVSEAARGEGGVLRNAEGERFMERYAPTIKDLAPRDLIARAIYTEFREGRGIVADDGTLYVHLDLTHLDKKIIDERLPDVTGFARTYLGVEPTREPIPVQPTTHYIMGGIPTDIDGRVLANAKGEIVQGLYAAGECACVSVHGANRLGTNSLVDIIVFGRRGGDHMADYIRQAEFSSLPDDADQPSREKIQRLIDSEGTESEDELRTTLQNAMMEYVSVYRDKEGLQKTLNLIHDLRDRYRKVRLQDKGKIFNTELIELLELDYLLTVAEIIVVSALNREESRGAHYREDFPERDDQKWLKHTFVYQEEGEFKIDYKPVSVTKFEPKERKY